MKNFKGRLMLLGVAAALAVCGCSAGSSDEAEAKDNAVQTTEAVNDMEQTVETAESDPVAQDMPVWISEETTLIEGGYVGARSENGEDGSPFRNMPVTLYDAEPSGEGGLVPTTVIDPDEEGGLFPTIEIAPEDEDSDETEISESEND